MREDFDKILKRTVNNMELKGSNTAEVTVKLKIELVPDYLPPASSDEEGRAILKPKFEHKVSSVMNTKFEESGSLKGDYELVWDEQAQDYIAKPIGFQQMSIYDTEKGCYEGYAEEVVDESPLMIEGATRDDENNDELQEELVDIDEVVKNLENMYANEHENGGVEE